MSDIVERIKKDVGMSEHGCMCCDNSTCCDALPEALDAIAALEARLAAIRKTLAGPYPVPKTANDIERTIGMLEGIAATVTALASE